MKGVVVVVVIIQPQFKADNEGGYLVLSHCLQPLHYERRAVIIRYMDGCLKLVF